MLQRVLVILFIGIASATSVAHASDWDNGGGAYYPPPDHGYRYDRAPPGNYGLRNCPPHGWAPPVRWVPQAYRWAPPRYRHWYPAYGYRGYGYQPRYRNDWDRRAAYRDDRHGRDDHNHDNYDHDDHEWRGH